MQQQRQSSSAINNNQQLQHHNNQQQHSQRTQHKTNHRNQQTARQTNNKQKAQEKLPTTVNQSTTTPIASTSLDDRLKPHYRARESCVKQLLSALEIDPWIQAPALVENVSVQNLSTQLVDETLHYFVNCGNSLSQMTKTYDDIDAIIRLLQEKEVDLELAARIGQDLLRQNNNLKQYIQGIESELEKHKGDLQQMRYDLASKTSLLETFIADEQDELLKQSQSKPFNNYPQQSSALLKHHDLTSQSNYEKKQPLQNKQRQTLLATQNHNDISPFFNISNHEQEAQQNGFLSLNCYSQKSLVQSVDPFSSLQNTPKYHKKSNITKECENGNLSQQAEQSKSQQEKLVEAVTFQLIESNRRLCELQDELALKNEQNRIQEDRILKLIDHSQDLNRSLNQCNSENESLAVTISETIEEKKELTEELKICKGNFTELLKVFVELQQECRFYREQQIFLNQNSTFLPTPNLDDEISFEEAFPDNHSRRFMSSCLLNEIQDSMRYLGKDDSLDENSDRDSGASTAISSRTPTTAAILTNSDDEDTSLGYESELLTRVLLTQDLTADKLSTSEIPTQDKTNNNTTSRHTVPRVFSFVMICNF